MNSLDLFKKYNLPFNVKVNVKVTSKGYFYAELPEYPGCITEANNFIDLVKNVTDAILTYFEIPKKDAEKLNIMYFPPQALTPKVEPIDRLIKAQQNKQEYTNIAVRFNYFTSLNFNGNNPHLW